MINNAGGTVDIGGELAYDLRQHYARIVGDHLDDIALARKADNYSIYFKSLKDLFIIVKHKFKDKKVKIIDPETKEQKEITQIEYFNLLLLRAVSLGRLHPNVWLGLQKNPEACALIEETLNDIEMFLYERIDEAKMFGGSNYIPGL